MLRRAGTAGSEDLSRFRLLLRAGAELLLGTKPILFRRTIGALPSLVKRVSETRDFFVGNLVFHRWLNGMLGLLNGRRKGLAANRSAFRGHNLSIL